MKRCFTCKRCLTCVSMLSQIKNIDVKLIGKVCRNNGGYQNAYLRFENDNVN